MNTHKIKEQIETLILQGKKLFNSLESERKRYPHDNLPHFPAYERWVTSSINYLKKYSQHNPMDFAIIGISSQIKVLERIYQSL